ncbi:sensor histidine kinase [Cryptosporangium aurantiacum]|uniref:histidine kinase n=1 Tax=Cryptosporangium aurantiacum TaxID=134849 RepID=A0A1M7IJA6_9ACTN|nr:histidine kinase [Cryptosporangium aurantiacum]SHM40497.1 Histidine kinase [Cryptosporangium aurantiacum]
MYAERVTLTRPARPSLPERARLAATVGVVVVAAAAASTALQWPLWQISPLLAGVNTVLAVAHAAVAPLLRGAGAGTRGRSVPWAFGVAGVCRSGTWIGEWHDAIPAIVGSLFNSAFWLLLTAAILYWSNHVNRWERRYLVVATVTMVGTDVLTAITDGAPAVRALTNVCDLALIAAFLTLVARRLGRVRGLERRTLRTAQVPAVVAAVAVLAAWALAGSPSGTGALWVPTVIGIALLALPITVVAATARLAAERADVADAVTGLSWPASPHRLQSALRRALRDPSIQIGYWVDGLRRYVDAEGREVEVPANDRFAVICQDGRTLEHETAERVPVPDVRFDAGVPVAILVGSPHHRHRTDLVATAVQAAGPALALAGLQAGIRAERQDLTAAHRKVEESRWAERRRLEQNLHDGAQHRLAALTMRLGAASATVPLDTRARDLMGEVQDEIREVLRELRELADGIHPSTLTESGLGPALEAVADRFPVPVTITAPARRFPPVVEAVAYYSTTEVLTIVTRQLNAAEIRVEVSARSGDLWVRTTAVGIGGDHSEKYFAALGGGIRAIGGELLAPSENGTDFTVAARIPCA